MRLKVLTRVLRILRVAAHYRLDGLVDAERMPRVVRAFMRLVPKAGGKVADMPRGARLRLALQELGPIFVKFGQILSTRRDLVPADVADELSLLQDQVAPFPGTQARSMVESELGGSVDALFARFEIEPLASASIAQVHAAQLLDGREVVVKVVRPGIHKRIDRDLELLRALARLAHRWHPQRERIQPREIVAEIEKTLIGELDLQREGANASLLRRNFKDSRDVRVPEVYWPYSKESVLVMERVGGIPIDDIDALRAAGVDLAALAEKGVRVFYTQVFRDNFFHADMHPGNIRVDPARPGDPQFILLDFGICGTLTPGDQRYLAENFMAMFNQDYRRIAELHVDAGWMPAHVRMDELESAVRTVCEPYFTRPLAEISLGEVLFKLFRVARRYELTIQPQLILLQKTLLNIEGLGRQLHPQIDIWAVAKPILAEIMRQKYGIVGTTAREVRNHLPEWLEQVPRIPHLVHDYLRQATRGELHARLSSDDIRRLTEVTRHGQRRMVLAVLGSALLVASTLLYVFGRGPGGEFEMWFILGLSSVASLWAFSAAWRRE